MSVVPEVNMLTVARSARAQRRAILGFAPKIGLSIVDYGGLDKMDNFYLECQNFRDYYRDPYNLLARPVAFRYHQGKQGLKVDKSVEDLMKPIKWVVEPQPIVFPIEYGKQMHFDGSIHLGGRFNRTSCIKFKR